MTSPPPRGFPSPPTGPSLSLPGLKSPWVRLGFMTVVLLVLVGVVFSRLGGPGIGEERPREPATQEVLVDIPIVDMELLRREVKDETFWQRLERQPKAEEHLLMLATRLGPGTLRAMGLAEETTSVRSIERDPGSMRGRPVSFRGTLENVYQIRERHPLPGVLVHSGRLRTEDGRDVLFKVVEPLSDEIRLGDWVRIEGLFFKMQNLNIPEEVRDAPLVIGRRLLPSWPIWEPVTELDPVVLAMARDEMPEEQQEIQLIPLYHLASYVMNLGPDDPVVRRAPDIREEHWIGLMEGDPTVPRGTPFRLTGAVARIEVHPAEENPLAVHYWSRVWIWSATVRSTIAIWVPGRVADFHLEDAVVATGFYLKRHTFESRMAGRPHTTCVFVASSVSDLLVESDRMAFALGLALLGLLLFVMGLFFVVLRREKARSLAALQHRIERRRRLREQAAAAGASSSASVAPAPASGSAPPSGP